MKEQEFMPLEEEFRRFAGVGRLGRMCIFRECLLSTNRYVLEAAEKGAAEGLLVCAERQTGGRGRQGRLWHSPAGLNLYFTVLLRPALPQVRWPQLAMLAALALREGVQAAMPGMQIGLKWPNDLWVKGRKLSGILCECGGDAVALGIGVNVNALMEDFPPDLQQTATSLRMETPDKTPLERGRVLAFVVGSLEKYYERWSVSSDFTGFVDEWNRHDILIGKQIMVQRPADAIECIVLGVEPGGFLRVKRLHDGAEVVISAGDVHIGKLPGSC